MVAQIDVDGVVVGFAVGDLAEAREFIEDLVAAVAEVVRGVTAGFDFDDLLVEAGEFFGAGIDLVLEADDVFVHIGAQVLEVVGGALDVRGEGGGGVDEGDAGGRGFGVVDDIVPGVEELAHERGDAVISGFVEGEFGAAHGIGEGFVLGLGAGGLA